MNYPFPTSAPYVQAAMSQAIQSILSGGPVPSNCVVVPMPYQQSPPVLPQLMMNSPFGANDLKLFAQQLPYYIASLFSNNPQARALLPQQNYNYPVANYKNNNNNNTKKSKKPTSQQPHSNIYNSSSFDSYMNNLSWSRLFDHPSRKNVKQQNPEKETVNNEKKPDLQKKPRAESSSSSSSSTSSTASDETIRRVNVSNKQTPNTNVKLPTKGTLPFKYSSEFVPGSGKQPPQNIKSNDVFIVKKP